MTTKSDTGPAAAIVHAPRPSRQDDRAFRRALAAAALLHALFLVGLWEAKPRIVGDLNGTDDPITVEIMTPGEQAVPGAAAPPASPAPPPAPEPDLKPSETGEAPSPQTSAQPPQAVAAAPPAPSETKPQAALPAQTLSETPDLFTLPDPSRARPDSAQAPKPQARQKPTEQRHDQGRKPPVRTSKLDLTLPDKLSVEEGAAGAYSAASTRPPNITRSPQNDEFGRGVIRALRMTMPPPLGTSNQVTIRFVLTEQGNILEVKVIRPSADPSFDRSVVYSAMQASFPLPPGGSTEPDRTFIVTYIYH